MSTYEHMESLGLGEVNTMLRSYLGAMLDERESLKIRIRVMVVVVKAVVPATNFNNNEHICCRNRVGFCML